MRSLRKPSAGGTSPKAADTSRTLGGDPELSAGAYVASHCDDPARQRIRQAAELAQEMRQTGGKHRLDA